MRVDHNVRSFVITPVFLQRISALADDIGSWFAFELLNLNCTERDKL